MTFTQSLGLISLLLLHLQWAVYVTSAPHQSLAVSVELFESHSDTSSAGNRNIPFQTRPNRLATSKPNFRAVEAHSCDPRESDCHSVHVSNTIDTWFGTPTDNNELGFESGPESGVVLLVNDVLSNRVETYGHTQLWLGDYQVIKKSFKPVIPIFNVSIIHSWYYSDLIRFTENIVVNYTSDWEKDGPSTVESFSTYGPWKSFYNTGDLLYGLGRVNEVVVDIINVDGKRPEKSKRGVYGDSRDGALAILAVEYDKFDYKSGSMVRVKEDFSTDL